MVKYLTSEDCVKELNATENEIEEILNENITEYEKMKRVNLLEKKKYEISENFLMITKKHFLESIFIKNFETEEDKQIMKELFLLIFENLYLSNKSSANRFTLETMFEKLTGQKQ